MYPLTNCAIHWNEICIILLRFMCIIRVINDRIYHEKDVELTFIQRIVSEFIIAYSFVLIRFVLIRPLNERPQMFFSLTHSWVDLLTTSQTTSNQSKFINTLFYNIYLYTISYKLYFNPHVVHWLDILHSIYMHIRPYIFNNIRFSTYRERILTLYGIQSRHYVQKHSKNIANTRKLCLLCSRAHAFDTVV